MSRFDLSSPPLPGSSTNAVKQWWADFEQEGTPLQKANLAARGIRAPEFAKKQHTMTPEYKSESYAEFVAAEDARLAPERERQRLAAIATSDCVLAAKQRKIERETERQHAIVAQAFCGFWATYTQGNPMSQYHRDFAFARGHVRDAEPHYYEIHEGYSAGLNRANRELNDPALHALYCPDGTSWRQRDEIIRKATEKKQAVAQAGHEN